MDSISLLRASYLAAALAVLLVSLVPALRTRFLAYGPRASSPSTLSSAEKEKAEAKGAPKDGASSSSSSSSSSVISRLLDELADCTVPHDYFWTFYFISCSLSAFWPGEVFWLKGPLYSVIADNTRDRGASMSFEQVKITWILMLLQGVRRLYESVTLSTSSDFEDDSKTSKMWIGHLVLGWLFYIATSVAVWVEGIPVLQTHTPTLRSLAFQAPTLRTTISVLLFILASGLQHDSHTYLAYLRASKSEDGKRKEGEYKIPSHPTFASLIAPHYTAECVIYFALALVAAPEGRWVNGTLACAGVFVGVNLGVTAFGTKEWYERKFGPEAVKGKWRMIPFVY